MLRKRVEHLSNICSSNIGSNIWSNILTIIEWIKVRRTNVRFTRKRIELLTEEIFDQMFDIVCALSGLMLARKFIEQMFVEQTCSTQQSSVRLRELSWWNICSVKTSPQTSRTKCWSNKLVRWTEVRFVCGPYFGRLARKRVEQMFFEQPCSTNICSIHLRLV